MLLLFLYYFLSFHTPLMNFSTLPGAVTSTSLVPERYRHLKFFSLDFYLRFIKHLKETNSMVYEVINGFHKEGFYNGQILIAALEALLRKRGNTPFSFPMLFQVFHEILKINVENSGVDTKTLGTHFYSTLVRELFTLFLHLHALNLLRVAIRHVPLASGKKDTRI